ncbi:UPF0182 family protein [Actinoplanes sp. NPDC026619]|uniref:UPF0182 family membrane protein n=1 Tax=Actinoplanes sp. NPDC026619 TaxID=3155798 RepID=UPI0033E94130
MSRRGRVTVGVLVGVFLLFTLLGWGIDAYTDYLWFHEVDFVNVFSGVLVTRLLLFVVIGLAVALIIAANLYLAYRLRPLLRPHSAEQATLERYRMVIGPRLGTWITVLCVIIGFFAGLSAQGRWKEWMLFQNAVPFGKVDPQFKVDIGFYVFDYPLWRYLLGVAFTAVVLSVLGSLAVHYIFGGVRLQGVGDRMTTAARAHLTTLVAVFVLLKAVAYILDRRALLLEQHVASGLYGAGYTDVNALLPAKEILAYISIVVAIAIIVFSNAGMRNLVWPGVSLALLAISAVAIGGIYPLAVQSFSVKPSQADKEAPYIQKSINATRDAFGLTSTDIEPYTATNVSPPTSLPTDTSAENVRVIDPQLVSQAFTQSQQSRGFYDFGKKLDVDRYDVGGKTSDFVVGAREINDDKLTTQQRNWLNRHTVYTHGYGLVAAPANNVGCAGLPYFVSGFLGNTGQASNCSSGTEQIKVDQPRIYYGEQSTEYAIVGQSDKSRKVEFDRPQENDEDQGEYYAYDGKGGVPVGSFLRKLVFSIKLTESNFLLSDAVNDNSKLMYIRDPRSRVEKVAPFLTIDGDPYPAAVDGRIVWILDGYTTSATYPYSSKINLANETKDELTGQGQFALARDDVNYMRNSVKATVDAYDGTVKLYEFDDQDPLLKAWNKAFGGHLIIPKADTPASLEAHFRYPQDLFKVQRNLLTKFHVTDPRAFFSGQDFWQVPNAPDNPQSNVKQPPYYLNVQLPKQTGTQFQLTAAVTPLNRENLAALVSASYVDNQPKLQVYELPDQTVIPGPVQVHRNMTANASVLQQLTLLSRNGQSQVLYGNLVSLPVSDGILYVEPVYVKTGNQDNAAPLLQKVLMSYGDGGTYVVLADNLKSGLQALVNQAKQNGNANGNNQGNTGNSGNTSGTPPATLPTELAQAAAELDTAIQNVKTAQQSGDFTKYGEALSALDTAMAKFQNAQKAATATTPPTPSGSASPSAPASTPANPAPSASG